MRPHEFPDLPGIKLQPSEQRAQAVQALAGCGSVYGYQFAGKAAVRNEQAVDTGWIRYQQDFSLLHAELTAVFPFQPQAAVPAEQCFKMRFRQPGHLRRAGQRAVKIAYAHALDYINPADAAGQRASRAWRQQRFQPSESSLFWRMAKFMVCKS